MTNRVPSPGKAGRVRIQQDDGQIIEGVMSMADDPITPGTPINKATLLQDSTAGALGLSAEDPTVDDAFRAVANAVFFGAVLAKIQVSLSPSGVAANVPLKITGPDFAKYTVTDSSGIVYAVLPANTTLTVQPNGVVDVSGSTEISTSTPGSQNFSVTLNSVNYVEFTESTEFAISGACTRVDACAVGGGGGGAAGYSRWGSTSAVYYSGAGGGGGNVVVQENVNFTPNARYQCVIGGGGAGGENNTAPGGTGGTTSILSVSASGGTGGTLDSGGTGNGSGGDRVTGGRAAGLPGGAASVQRFSGFSAMAACCGGGGSGAATYSNDGITTYGGDGGSPYGGSGADTTNGDVSDGGNATGIGGGGGGGSVESQYSSDSSPSFGKGGSGYAGIACLRMWH